MERISKETTILDLVEWFNVMGFEVKELGEKNISVKRDGVLTYITKTASDNILFLIGFNTLDDIDELTILKKINDINGKIMSACLVYNSEHGVVSYGFSLIRPFGMGFKGFATFVDYNVKLISFIMKDMGLSEMTK